MPYFLKLFNRNVLIYTLADGFYYGGYSVINAFLSILVTDKITNGRVDIASYVVSYYLVLRAIAELPLANFVRRYSDTTKLKIVTFGYISYGILILLMGFSDAVWQIFLLQTGIALIDALTYPIRWPIFTKVVDRGNEELEWGIEDVAGTILPAGFSALAGIIAEAYGISSAFYVFGPVFMISGFGFSFIDLRNHPHKPKTPKHAREALHLIVGKLRAMNAPFEISGGLAAQLQGSRRALADIDIDVHESTIDALYPQVKEYVVFGPARYQDKNWDLYMMTLKYKTQYIDLCGIEHSKIYDLERGQWTNDHNDFGTFDLKNIFGLRIPVSTRAELIAYKSKLKRLVDNMDIAQISEHQGDGHIYDEPIPAEEPPVK